MSKITEREQNNLLTSIVKKTKYKWNVDKGEVIHWEINNLNIINKQKLMKVIYIPRKEYRKPYKAFYKLLTSKT